MRANEIIVESKFDPEIRTKLEKKGYKFLGKGVDQMAFLEPGSGMVLKIFGTSTGVRGFTRAQETFKTFADFCIANPNNEFLPQFSGWETFEFKGQTYLQIRMERLFPFPNDVWADYLGRMEDFRTKEEFIRSTLYWQTIRPGRSPGRNNEDVHLQELMSHLGDKGFNQLWSTIKKLKAVANDNGYVLDLHGGNFMLGSDGHIVISDPFWEGDERW